MRKARAALKRHHSRNAKHREGNPVLQGKEPHYLLQPASEMDREDFCRVLAASIPSLQPYEISMCWEVKVQNEIDGTKEAKAPSAGNFSFTLTQISVSWSFRSALTFCIVLNAVSMMLDDPLCDPVDSNGSTLCIFNCAEVVSSIDGHPCDTNLEIVRQQLEFLLLVIFTTEMGILLVTMSFRYFLDTWNQIDFVVISLSWVTVFVDQLTSRTQCESMWQYKVGQQAEVSPSRGASSPKWVFVVRALVTVFLTQIRVGLRFCPLYVADSKPQSRVKWPGRGAGNFVLSTLLSVLKCYFLSGSRRVVVSTQKTKFRRN